MLKPQRDIISVANDKRSPLQSRLDLVFEPPVQDFVQVDVAQQGTYNTALLRTRFRVPHRAILHDARVQPLPDHSSYHPVAHPSVEKGLQMFSTHRIEEALDVQIDHPTTPDGHQAFP
jgi:hypothetical protein